jgi:hypothetical protein
MSASAGDGFGTAQFDGRWLVYVVQTSPDNSAQWKIYAWDSTAGGTPQLIANSAGKDIPAGPFVVPQVSGGKATWVFPLADGRREVHLYDLATGRDKIVAVAHVYRSAFVGDLLVWEESDAPGAETVLKAVHADTARPTALPPVVAAIRQTGEIVGDGTTWAWLAPDYSGVYEWKPGWSHSATVVSGRSSVQYLSLSGSILTFRDDRATYAADLASHSLTQITPQYGVSMANGPWLEVGYPPSGDKHAQTSEYQLDTTTLPALPNCASWQPVAEPDSSSQQASPGPQ